MGENAYLKGQEIKIFFINNIFISLKITVGNLFFPKLFEIFLF